MEALEDLVDAAVLRPVAGLQVVGAGARHLQDRPIQGAHGVDQADLARPAGRGGSHRTGRGWRSPGRRGAGRRPAARGRRAAASRSGPCRPARRVRSPSACASATSTRMPYSARVESFMAGPPRSRRPRRGPGRPSPGRTGGRASTRPVKRSKRPPWRGHSTASPSSSPSPSSPPSWVQTSSMAPQRAVHRCAPRRPTGRRPCTVTHRARRHVAGAQAGGEPGARGGHAATSSSAGRCAGPARSRTRALIGSESIWATTRSKKPRTIIRSAASADMPRLWA